MHIAHKPPKNYFRLKFDLRFEIYTPDFLYDEKFRKLNHDFGYF